VRTPAHPPRYRPFRVVTYALYFVVTGLFIGCLAWGIGADLYRAPDDPSDGAATLPTCIEELETLFKRLQARSGAAVEASGDKDWSRFTAEFEGRLSRFEARCVDQAPAEADAGVRDALAEAARQLDNLRLHLSRCGEEGDREAAAVRDALHSLRQAARASGH